MDILYIIGKGRSLCDNKELRYSLRSLSKHGKGIDRIFVAGYCPEWLSNDIIKIPFEQPYQEKNISVHHKHCNIASTILHVIDNSDIGETFLVSMDDHMYVRDTNFNDYPVYVSSKPYGEGNDRTLLPSKQKDVPEYQSALSDTREFLESMGLPAYCFCIHRNMYMSRNFLNEYRETITSMIHTGKIAEIFAFWGNAEMKNHLEYTPIKDVLVRGGGDWWKTDSRNTEVFSVVDFKENSGLDILLEGLFPNKCKYEK